jgi:hypothetical protein
MTRRRKLAVAGIAVALALAAGVGVVVALRPASLEGSFKQLREGMTYAEVLAILGEPDGTVLEPSRPGWTGASGAGAMGRLLSLSHRTSAPKGSCGEIRTRPRALLTAC